MNPKASIVRRRLIAQWGEVVAALNKFNAAAEVRPENGDSVFSEDPDAGDGIIAFDLKPVVFNLPERADNYSTDLFIVVGGRLSVRQDSVDKDVALLTHDFSTRAAYFRRTKKALIHVYGAHYDFALNELGHPTFHMQLRSFADLASLVRERYVVPDDFQDNVDGMLRNVRLPCAQMDFFSFFSQLCADHLIFKDSEKEVRAAFNQLITKSSFLRGAGARSERLVDEAAHGCYRSSHWYPLVA
ncbi:hypothetical protein [Burkholderia sp. AU15512]|uniref:hypothetical protein n=1 Tax=Burkholderia sp. AU15512 TaxID=2015345 RepID=UPI00117DD454|nr:hypothetical protein [Burkholderia sp. AU15512]